MEEEPLVNPELLGEAQSVRSARPRTHQTLDIASITRPDFAFVTIGTVRHSFTCPKALELTTFARNPAQLVALCRSIELHTIPGP